MRPVNLSKVTLRSNPPGRFSSLTVSGATDLKGDIAINGDVKLNRPVYFTSGELMIDPKNRAIFLNSVKSSNSKVGDLLVQTATTTNAATNAVATSVFSSVASATSINKSSTATAAITINTTAKQFNRTTRSTGTFTDRIVIGATTYAARPLTVKNAQGKNVVILAYQKL